MEFEAAFAQVKREVGSFAAALLQEYGQDAREDSGRFLDLIKGDLAQWCGQLQRGEMSEVEFRFLLRAKKNLAEMKALRQKGLLQARIDMIVEGILARTAAQLVRALG